MFKLFHSGRPTKHKQSILQSQFCKKTAFIISCLTICSAYGMQTLRRAPLALWLACKKSRSFPAITANLNGSTLTLKRKNGPTVILNNVEKEKSCWKILVHVPTNLYPHGTFTLKNLNSMRPEKITYFVDTDRDEVTVVGMLHLYGTFTLKDLERLYAGEATYFINNGDEMWARLVNNGALECYYREILY